MATTKGSSYRVFRPEVWSSYVRHYFNKNLVAARHFRNFSDDVTGGGETITIPHIDEGPEPSSVTTTTGALTDNVISDTRTQLVLDSWKASVRRFTDFQVAQIASKYNLQADYAKDIAYTLAKKFDTDLLTEARDNLQLNVNDSTTAITATDCRNAMSIYDSYSIPRDQGLFILNPGSYWALMRDDVIVEAHKFGEGAPMASGYHARIFGMPVVITANTPTWGVASAKTNFIVHSRAIAYAIANITGMGSGPRLQWKETEDLAKRLVGDLAYGVKILDSYGGIKIKSSE